MCEDAYGALLLFRVSAAKYDVVRLTQFYAAFHEPGNGRGQLKPARACERDRGAAIGDGAPCAREQTPAMFHHAAFKANSELGVRHCPQRGKASLLSASHHFSVSVRLIAHAAGHGDSDHLDRSEHQERPKPRRFDLRRVHRADRDADSAHGRIIYNVEMRIWHTGVTPLPSDLAHSQTGTMMEHLGIELTEFGDDFLAARMPVDARTMQPFGLLHGGASAALAETLGSIGGWRCVDPAKKAVVGLELNCNHIRAVRGGWVHGVARPAHLGSSTHVWDVRITNDDGKLVCVARLTLAVLDRAA